MISLLEAVKTRHAVRSYTDRKIEGDVLEQLMKTIGECNRESGLNIQLCLNEPGAFTGMMARYGRFENVRNYIALVGKKSRDFEEKCGYYGQKIALSAAQLGLHTCWVALSYRKGKSAAVVKRGEKLLMVIAVGYGSDSGKPHKGKTVEKLCRMDRALPDWFIKGVQAVQLAPTAMNQQKFYFELEGSKVRASAGTGFYTKTDLGIAKYHFEIGAESGDWEWESENVF